MWSLNYWTSREVLVSFLSLSLSSLSPSAKKMLLYLFICEIMSQEMYTQAVQSGLSYNSFVKSTNIYKALPGATQSAIGSFLSLDLALSLLLCHGHRLVSDFPCFPPRSLPWSQNWPPCLLAGPLNPHCQSWLTCKPDDIRLLVKPSGAPHGFQARV